jgi:N-acetyl sugar amidotransferase
MVQICTRCIYDETIPGISFDDEGICNYCREFERLEQEYPCGDKGWEKLQEIASDIKKSGKNKKYDCIVGVSGGCDSSYLLYLVKKRLGLRPLAVHYDNTWNSKIAVENIHQILKALDVDLYTHVADNEEFNDMSRSFLYASVSDVDTTTDIGFITALYLAAEKYDVKYILEGACFRTEGITPLGWVYMDGKYIESVHKQFGQMKVEKYQNLTLLRWIYWLLKGIKRPRLMYYLDYNKEEVKKFLMTELDWQWYGGHHMENRYAFFANNYMYPLKFKRDLRVVEFSALIRSGQMSRDDALKEIQTPPQFDDELLDEIKKRLKLSDDDFRQIMDLPIKSYRDYETYRPTFIRLRPFFWLMYKANLIPKAFYTKYANPEVE